jgi:conjugative transfer signal peptidase TraF
MSLRLRQIALGGMILLFLGFVCYAVGARVNTTGSIPVGLYRTSGKPAGKGDYVMVCPPPSGVFDMAKERGYIQAGFCPGGYGYLMKRILAAKNDTVAVADDGVRVNGRLLPFSKVLKVDQSGRPLPRYQADTYTLNEHQVLLMTDRNPLSFDGRYFGPLNRSQIKSVIIPIITW